MRHIKKLLAISLILLFALSACADAEEAPPQAPAPVAENTFSFPFPFTAYDLYGNAITEQSLGEFEIFFVYFWTTTCPACVRGMPGIVTLAQEFDNRVGVLSLLGDFQTNGDAAKRILQDAGAPFITLDARNEDFIELMALLNSGFVPTSVVLDANGNAIGGMIIGANTDRLREAIEDALP
ncbi:MAG: TlpA family protein disulfide reductase [Defluviitaleaceae bacterium]|nr:TlpA family protein disulfide reductase [Defluviitaleaceae bacterium]MCL2274641.1 TlpA family protein disulfide reductase [Defluviitaleaceae bacterium]